MSSAAAALLAATVMSACRPLYIPLVPDAPPVQAVTRLSDDSELTVVDGRPRLVLSLASLGADATERDGAWLAVQWYGPSGAQAASESRWLQGETAGLPLVFVLPADVDAAPGEWRAVVSLSGALLRQFRVDVAADPEE